MIAVAAAGRRLRRRSWRRAVVLGCLGLLASPLAAPGESPPCPDTNVCKESSSPPAEDWFRHGLEALALGENDVAACALERASRLEPDEDGHNLSAFVKPMLDEIKPLPRECVQSSAPLDKKKYFPRLYLAKAYLAWAMRSGEAQKKEYCKKALQSLDNSPDSAPLANVRRQLEGREKIDRDLKDSQCCRILPSEARCSQQTGGTG